jgi:hypothetical protein
LDNSLRAWLYVVEKQVNEVESDREGLVLGRSMKPLVVRINMYKNRYGSVEILISMFGGCSERQLEDSLRAWLYVLVEKQVNEVE